MTDRVPMPVASPGHPRPADGDTHPGIATTGYTKQKLRKYAAGSGGVGALVVAAMTWWFETRASEAKTQTQQVDTASMERLVKLEQKLSDHIDAENQRWLSSDTHQSKSDQVQAVMNAKLDMELDRHGVPRDRRPRLEDFEPAGPPGEQK